MKIEIWKEHKRFIDNYDFNNDLALMTEKPHLARWAYGACEKWIKDFENSVYKTDTVNIYKKIIRNRKDFLEKLKEKLMIKF